MDDRPTRVSARFAVCISTLVASACVSVADAPSPTDPHPALPASTTTTTNAVALEPGLESYRECLAIEGVNIGEIELDGLGRPRLERAMSELDLTDPAVLDALDVCAGELAHGPLDLTPDPEMGDLVVALLWEFADCVRDRGVSGFPDPAAGFDGVGSPFPAEEIPWSDPDLADAVVDCREEVLLTRS